jgi:hypothetical protein
VLGVVSKSEAQRRDQIGSDRGVIRRAARHGIDDAVQVLVLDVAERSNAMSSARV